MLLPALEYAAHSTQGVFTAAQATSAGYTHSEQRSAVKRGAWRTLRRGIYTTNEKWESVDALGQHALLCQAACLATTGEKWISHQSAVALYGLPTLYAIPDEVRLTVERQHQRVAKALHAHTARMPEPHRATFAGLPITTIARTLCDLARHTDYRDALCAVDSALHSERVSTRQLEAVLDFCSNWPGVASARRVMDAADARAESPGETLSRIAIWASDLPRPELQVALHLPGGEVRPDFLWREQRVIGEFDGLIKYNERMDLVREKQREDRLRAAGFLVLRWGWNEVMFDSRPLISRIRTVLEHARSITA